MEDPFWTKRSGGTVGYRSFLRRDGLKLWYHLFRWDFKTVDCGYGSVPQDGWKREPTDDEAKAWVDLNIPMVVSRLELLTLT